MGAPRHPRLWPKSSDALVERLRSRLKRRRFQHVLGVLQTALGLAHSHGADPERVAWAALLHDLSKTGPHDSVRERCEALGEVIDDEDLAFPAIWHGWAGAAEGRQEWGMEDSEILDAVRHHSTGHPEMGTVGKILMIADFLEPTRDAPDRHDLLAGAHADLDGTLAAILRHKCRHMESRGKTIHPRAGQALEALRRSAGQTDPSEEVESSAP